MLTSKQPNESSFLIFCNYLFDAGKKQLLVQKLFVKYFSGSNNFV